VGVGVAVGVGVGVGFAVGRAVGFAVPRFGFATAPACTPPGAPFALGPGDAAVAAVLKQIAIAPHAQTDAASENKRFVTIHYP
jgi:hypothetical protein